MPLQETFVSAETAIGRRSGTRSGTIVETAIVLGTRSGTRNGTRSGTGTAVTGCGSLIVGGARLIELRTAPKG